tara:strand:+ start:1631 stop:1951 length:321 start_codon:yes stop_codon:yes gene_type:complete
MNASLGFDALAMALSTAAAIFHSIHIYDCRKKKDRDKEARCDTGRRPLGKMFIILSLICVSLAIVINMLVPEPSKDARTHHLVKTIHVFAILLPVTVAELFILDNV